MKNGGEYISIIMPAYNAANYISASIQSVLDQTYSRWELIIIDDGSTDNTLEIANSFAKSDSRISAYSKENEKQAKARNYGIARAKYEWIAFIDSDDVWMPNKLQQQLTVLTQDPTIGFIYTTGFVFHNNHITDEKELFDIYPGKHLGKEMLLKEFLANRIATVSVITKKEFLVVNGLFADRTPCEDYDMWMKIAFRGVTFFGLNEPLFRYRMIPSSSSKNFLRRVEMDIEIIKEYFSKVNLNERQKLRRLHVLYRQKVKFLAAAGRVNEAKRELDTIFTGNALVKLCGSSLKFLLGINLKLYRLLYEAFYKFSLLFRYK
jgi:teichuronic acid biosynthesis glycosyltransferase TuaG